MMNSLKNNYSLQIAVATVLASTMILVTENGVAEAVKVTEGTALTQLPPPGPFAQVEPDGKGGSLAPVAPKVNGGNHEMPLKPEMPEMKKNAPELSATPPEIVQPVNTAIEKKIALGEPEFKRAMPSIPKALQVMKPPSGLVAQTPDAPAKPKAIVAPTIKTAPVLTREQIAVAPNFVATLPPGMPQYPTQPMMQPFHGKMPVFNGSPGNIGFAPKMQQYRYIPLPVIQSNYGRPQMPAFNGIIPPPIPSAGYWIPQPNTINR